MKRSAVVLALAGTSLLGACGSSSKMTLQSVMVKPDKPSEVTLSTQQVTILRDAVGALAGTGEKAAYDYVAVATASGQTHVCGTVTPDAASRLAQAGRRAIPFYLELRMVDGAPAPHRGQVGLTTSNAAKIKFVCQRQGL
ncbi:MAG: hypothetical protein AAFR04_10950 [Pseudomonadota bacterium]